MGEVFAALDSMFSDGVSITPEMGEDEVAVDALEMIEVLRQAGTPEADITRDVHVFNSQFHTGAYKLPQFRMVDWSKKFTDPKLISQSKKSYNEVMK